MDLFRVLDIGRRSVVSRDDIRFFMRELGLPIDEVGLDAMIRRLDHDGDELLNYSEFVEALTPVGFAPAESLPRQSSVASPLRSSSPLRQSSPSRGSPSRSSPQRGGSPARTATAGSPYRSPTRTAGSPERGSPNRALLVTSSYDSPSRHSYLSESSRVY